LAKFLVFLLLVIAAIETAIALCIVLSYYRITNKNINALKNTTDFFSGVTLILTIERCSIQ
jgi:NADH:ubiquinone oxidoreductase subunit K